MLLVSRQSLWLGSALQWTLPASHCGLAARPKSTQPHAMQVGQPVVRVAQGKLQLGVVLDSKASSLLVAVVVPSRIAPGTTVNKSQVKCACQPSCLLRIQGHLR